MAGEDELAALKVGDRFTLSKGGAGMGPCDHLWLYEVASIKPGKIDVKRVKLIEVE